MLYFHTIYRHNHYKIIFVQTKIYQLNPSDVQILEEIGDGKYGKVFKAQILSNLQYCPGEPVPNYCCSNICLHNILLLFVFFIQNIIGIVVALNNAVARLPVFTNHCTNHCV